MAGNSMDIDSIIKGMASPEVGENSLSVMQMLDEMNKLLGKFQTTVGMLDKMGVKPLIVRAIGKQFDVDAESPLRTENGFQPKTDAHAKIYEHLNIMSETDLTAMFTAGKKGGEEDDV